MDFEVCLKLLSCCKSQSLFSCSFFTDYVILLPNYLLYMQCSWDLAAPPPQCIPTIHAKLCSFQEILPLLFTKTCSNCGQRVPGFPKFLWFIYMFCFIQVLTFVMKVQGRSPVNKTILQVNCCLTVCLFCLSGEFSWFSFNSSP